MIPLWAVVRIEPAGGRALRLWLPLVVVWLLLLPLAVLLLPLLAVYCACRRINPIPAVGALCGVLSALRGTRVEVRDPGALVLIQIV